MSNQKQISVDTLLKIREVLIDTKKEDEEKSLKDSSNIGKALYSGHAIGVKLGIDLIDTILNYAEDK